MKTRIELADLEELIAENNYPQNFGGKFDGIVERTYSAEPWLGKGSYKETFFNGIHIGYGDMNLSRTTSLRFVSDFETVEMHFALEGHTFTKEAFSSKTYEFKGGQHNIVFATGFKGVSDWSQGDMKIFEVNLLPEFFARHLPDGYTLFRNFKKAIDQKNNALLGASNYPINAQMFLVIHDVLTCHRVGEFKKMFLESKVIELLLLQLEQIAAFDDNPLSTLAPRDIEKMHAVRELLVENMSHYHSLQTLAAAVGTNEFTLKKGFKEVFGKTVFQYFNELKMTHAREMLMKDDLSVGEVSALVGYKNPQHFSTAFKRRYGITPIELKLCR
ncbi:AraC family transcriptional regulator [Fulvivirgaceae bacterium BMA12]|uniref:AraC family transcriptional regulator n=1 Tax=Agaribacillus aureus TaxID=3051825 RepID=A0ABT8LLU6_9BACT|nr:AraC family transcriptional regulator [Fulvivirgaceae bacterium BMA12]